MLRKSSNELIQKFVQTTSSSTVKNEKLLRLYDNFHLHYDQLLPTEKPKYVKQTPYEFHSTVNGNENYININRLSVTKLLTESWCELREYYNIYSGSLREEKTESLILGSKYHETLELEDFEVINIHEFEKILEQVFGKDEVVDNESELFVNWFENIIFKLFHLILKSDTREVLVHNFLDLNRGQFNPKEDDAVLISGIIDHIKFEPFVAENYSMFEEIQAYTDFNEFLNLNELFITAASIINSYKDQYKLNFIDVKTRQYNKIPNQESVIKSAYLQISYYKYFFDVMSNDIDNCYNMLCKNATTRHCDLDKPINPKTLFSLLRKYPQLLLTDFKTLAVGDSIEFSQFDNYESKYDAYDFTSVFTPDHMKTLKEIDDFNYESILNPHILTKWSKPVTLRYLISRSSQFFNLFRPFNLFNSPKSNTVSIEYHNLKTNYNFKTINYKYDPMALQYSIDSATKFWNGLKPPNINRDLSKCKYCDFNSKCQIPNKDLKSLGAKLTGFLSS